MNYLTKKATCRRPKLILTAALLAFTYFVLVPLDAREAPQFKVDDAPLPTDARPPFTFAPIIKKVRSSVVNVYTAKTIREASPLSPLFDDPFLRQFFGGGRWEAIPSERREQSLGSGVVVTSDGYILTNNHVVANADEIKVALADNATVYSATVVGADPETDIAVLKVDAKNLPAITVTDSDHLEVGDLVLALGNPFGIGQTVTMGIVSAKGRAGMGIVNYEDFIQTDASINPGNSGGALVDAAGRLVGINSAILSGSGGNQGIGFAIPTNLARNVMERLVIDGRIRRGQLGITTQPVTPALAREFKLPEKTGALVAEVAANSPGAAAGLRPGDVIIEFNGKKVTDNEHLRLMIGQTSPGTKVSLKVLRDGQEQSFATQAVEEPTETAVASTVRSGGLHRGSSGDALAGISVEDVDLRARRQFHISTQIRAGALVIDVAPGSPAAEAGLTAGDVILEINRQPVKNADDAVTKSRDVQNTRVLLRVWSGGSSRYVVLEANAHR